MGRNPRVNKPAPRNSVKAARMLRDSTEPSPLYVVSQILSAPTDTGKPVRSASERSSLENDHQSMKLCQEGGLVLARKPCSNGGLLLKSHRPCTNLLLGRAVAGTHTSGTRLNRKPDERLNHFSFPGSSTTRPGGDGGAGKSTRATANSRSCPGLQSNCNRGSCRRSMAGCTLITGSCWLNCRRPRRGIPWFQRGTITIIGKG